jgi:hypothetical protein
MEDITRRREDMTFIYESWKQYFTHVIDIFTSEDIIIIIIIIIIKTYLQTITLQPTLLLKGLST